MTKSEKNLRNKTHYYYKKTLRNFSHYTIITPTPNLTHRCRVCCSRPACHKSDKSKLAFSRSSEGRLARRSIADDNRCSRGTARASELCSTGQTTLNHLVADPHAVSLKCICKKLENSFQKKSRVCKTLFINLT